ncbi:hypothetical protein ACH5RR_041854 [Cinchona calisaya]|uniref:TF-B3 domain-containing protein n=1 Tax=Cinchona calisaya TaxID=153742 RepID=A0ABD2XUP1_9GENT
MMNFMGAGSSRQGFYEDDSKGSTTVRLPFSNSSSSSSPSCTSPSLANSSFHHQQSGHLIPLSSYHQLQPRGPWDDSSFGRSYMDSSPSPTATNINVHLDSHDLESDEHLAASRRGGGGGGGGGALDSSEGGVGGSSSSSALMIEREHMFDKVVTPSDVGKLNRLVIPKQHAEKYFPLDSSTNEKGLLLNFEDRNGKPWRFRYSYWNSSQSYVMTKGWSRFVKEKKLDAGDVVSFQRGVGELGKDRLFIDWRRRPDAHHPDHHHHHQFLPSIPTLSIPHHQYSFHHSWNHPFYLQQQQHQSRDHSQLLQVNATSINSTHPSHHHHHLNSNYAYGSVMTPNPCSSSIIYLRSAAVRPQQVGVGMMQLHKGGGSGLIRGSNEEPMVFESVPVVQGKAAAKRLRLFGVNMDCPIPDQSKEEEEEDECDILSSTALPPHSSSSSISPLQLSPPLPYNGSPLFQTMPSDIVNKGKASTSLDFDI